jgi:hypothetical protein
MDNAAERLTLDDDVLEGLRRLAARSGRPLDALVNGVLRDYVRYENGVNSSAERGVSGLDADSVSSSEEVLEILRRAREALASNGGVSREESITRARAAVEEIRSRKP